jgi:hypothetical protein
VAAATAKVRSASSFANFIGRVLSMLGLSLTTLSVGFSCGLQNRGSQVRALPLLPARPIYLILNYNFLGATTLGRRRDNLRDRCTVQRDQKHGLASESFCSAAREQTSAMAGNLRLRHPKYQKRDDTDEGKEQP